MADEYTAMSVRLPTVVYEALRAESYKLRVPMSRLITASLIATLEMPE
jgi:hypothetical protein